MMNRLNLLNPKMEKIREEFQRLLKENKEKDPKDRKNLFELIKEAQKED